MVIRVNERLEIWDKEAWDNFLDDDRVSWLLVPPFEYKKGC